MKNIQLLVGYHENYPMPVLVVHQPAHFDSALGRGFQQVVDDDGGRGLRNEAMGV